jgi:uncharacterized membrane protein
LISVAVAASWRNSAGGGASNGHGLPFRFSHAPVPERPPGSLGHVPVDVVTELVIERPRAEVASYAGDPTHAPEWYANIHSVKWLTPPPVAVGSRIDFVAQFLGRRLAYTYEVVELRPGERLVMRTAQGPFPMETTYEWTSVGERATRMKLRNRGDPAGFSRLAAPLMASAVRRANRHDLGKLKRILEEQPAAPSPP